MAWQLGRREFLGSMGAAVAAGWLFYYFRAPGVGTKSQSGQIDAPPPTTWAYSVLDNPSRISCLNLDSGVAHQAGVSLAKPHSLTRMSQDHLLALEWKGPYSRKISLSRGAYSHQAAFLELKDSVFGGHARFGQDGYLLVTEWQDTNGNRSFLRKRSVAGDLLQSIQMPPMAHGLIYSNERKLWAVQCLTDIESCENNQGIWYQVDENLRTSKPIDWKVIAAPVSIFDFFESEATRAQRQLALRHFLFPNAPILINEIGSKLILWKMPEHKILVKFDLAPRKILQAQIAPDFKSFWIRTQEGPIYRLDLTSFTVEIRSPDFSAGPHWLLQSASV